MPSIVKEIALKASLQLLFRFKHTYLNVSKQAEFIRNNTRTTRYVGSNILEFSSHTNQSLLNQIKTQLLVLFIHCFCLPDLFATRC